MRLKQAFLDSAGRHNQVPTMDTNGFAALIAAVIIDEGHLDADPRSGGDEHWRQENILIDLGCIVSGHILKQVCWDEPDPEKCVAYLSNELPEGHPLYTLASVGIGNIKLYTAANVWRGRACRVIVQNGAVVEECVQAQASPLRQTKRLLRWKWEVDILNPFEGADSYDPTEVTSAYQMMAQQLRNERTNIEYAAAILEQGALRARSLGIMPSAFNSASWYIKGVQTDDEIAEWWPHPGAAIFVLWDIPKVLEVWGLNTSWDLSTESQYEHWRRRLGW